MNETDGVQVPDGALLEATVTWRQLHVTTMPTTAHMVDPARACGVEARGQPQHRTQVKPRKAGPTWVSVPPSATPDVQSRRDGTGDGGGGKWLVLTSGDLGGSVTRGRRRGDALPTSTEKSDHPIVAMKPGNAGGARGVTD